MIETSADYEHIRRMGNLKQFIEDDLMYTKLPNFSWIDWSTLILYFGLELPGYVFPNSLL